MSDGSHIVAGDEADLRLDRWLRRHFSRLPQGAIERLCRTGQVRLDGKRITASERLSPGQVVRVPPLKLTPAAARPPPDAETTRELEARILYRDSALLVLNKPSGLPVQGGPGITHHLDGLLDALRFEAIERPRLVHRLDRATAGVLVLARSAAAAASLAASFRMRAVEKTYWAVVIGRPLPPSGRIFVPLQRTHQGSRSHTEADERGKRAVTDYRTLDRAGRRFAWLLLAPLTGRTHQLRVHCAALGHPILGDATYGGTEAEASEFPPELHLFARGLALPHPGGGRLLVEAPLPAHFVTTFRILGFRAPAAAAPVRASSPHPL